MCRNLRFDVHIACSDNSFEDIVGVEFGFGLPSHELLEDTEDWLKLIIRYDIGTASWN